MPTKILTAILIGIITLISVTGDVKAITCTSNINPTVVQVGRINNFVYSITNDGPEEVAVVNIRMSDPSVFLFTDANTSNWDADIGGDTLTFRRGSIPPGESTNFYFSMNTLLESSSTQIEVSVSSNGSDYYNCSGTNGVSSTNEIQVFSVSNVQATVSSTTASFTWNSSSISDSIIYYGLVPAYGQTASSGELVTSHSLNLVGLTPSSTYYYKVCSRNTNNEESCSDQGTLTTAAVGTTQTVTITNTVTNTVTNTTTSTVTKILTDTTPPVIRFLDELQKIYEEAPLVGIKITDGSGIARLEYSFDGKNFLPIDIGEAIGNKTITTDFIPKAEEDGDYSLVVRAVDTSGNIGSSKKVNFTIDRLPPRIGPLIVMAGPLLVNGGNNGKLELSQGVEYKFILSAAGGPNSISLNCKDKIYEFVKNNDIGVWTAKIKFSESLNCIPEITATDGAGNIQTTKSEELKINNLGKLENGLLTVYWYDDYEKKFVVWDALPYGQINPIDTRLADGYSLLLPKGRYYLEAKALNKRVSVSNIINIDSTSLINNDWELSPAWKFWQIREQKIITPKILGNSSFKDVNFALPKVNLGSLSTLDIRGKNSIVFLFSSWHPEANNILKVMEELNGSKYSVYPILLHEKETVARSVKKRGGFGLSIYSDNDGEVVKEKSILGLPTVWIIDRFGQVVKEKTGYVDYKEIVDTINNID